MKISFVFCVFPPNTDVSFGPPLPIRSLSLTTLFWPSHDCSSRPFVALEIMTREATFGRFLIKLLEPFSVQAAAYQSSAMYEKVWQFHVPKYIPRRIQRRNSTVRFNSRLTRSHIPMPTAGWSTVNRTRIRPIDCVSARTRLPFGDGEPKESLPVQTNKILSV